jgi:hypothetical protein
MYFCVHQAPPSLLNPLPNTAAEEMASLTRGVIIVVSFSIIAVVVILLRKGKKKSRRDESSKYFK